MREPLGTPAGEHERGFLRDTCLGMKRWHEEEANEQRSKATHRRENRLHHALAPYDHTSYTYSQWSCRPISAEGVVDDVRDSRGVYRSER